MSRTRKKSSVLSGQKPRRSWRLAPLAPRRLLHVAKILAVVFGAIFLLKAGDRSRQKLSSWTRAMLALDEAWRVHLHLDSEYPLSAKKIDDLLLLTKQELGATHFPNLTLAAVKLQRLDAYSRVHIMRTGLKDVLVSVRPRIAIMCAEVDRLRLVDASGTIYGVFGSEGAPHCPGPRLIGLKGEGSRTKINEDQTITLSSEEQRLVHEALELLSEAKVQGLELSSIEIHRHRGFQIALRSEETEISLGHHPFSSKLERLKTLLGKLKERSEKAARIELDYQGKAFVKLRKT